MGRPFRILIVADDLTGAMDSAGPFATAGVETWVVADPMRCDPATLRFAAVVSVNTDSRQLPAAQAADRVRAIVEHLGTEGYEIVFKKIDSTLRGNVVAETCALMRACDRTDVVIAPAFPAQGRTVRSGMVHVNDTPLAQTAFAKDKLSAPPLRPLHEEFAASGRIAATSGSATPAFLGEAFDGARVVDALDDGDLAAIVSAVRPRIQSLLLAGSAGLTQALAQACFAGRTAANGQQRVQGNIVFAVGSRAPECAGQVEVLAMDAETHVLLAPNGRLPQGELPEARNLVLKATADETGREGDAAQVAADMARNAIDVARRIRAEAIVATGGDTAIAIMAASGNSALQVLGDLMPGIPYARIRIDGTVLWLVTKAGGFGGREIFRDLVRTLRGSG